MYCFNKFCSTIPTGLIIISFFTHSGFSITSFSSSGTNLVGSGNFTITCVGDVTQNGVESLNVTIQDPSNIVLASMVYNMPMTGESYPVNYTFSPLSFSDAGAYTCALAATLNTTANADQGLNIEGMHHVFSHTALSCC